MAGASGTYGVEALDIKRKYSFQTWGSEISIEKHSHSLLKEAVLPGGFIYPVEGFG
jgi:hypothetical protein